MYKRQDLIPQLKERQPQVYFMAYAADREHTINELQEQVDICRPLVGEKWDDAYKVLVRTKTDKGGKIPDWELASQAQRFGANDCIQVDARLDNGPIVEAFRKAFGTQIEKYKLNHSEC